jgi:peptide/nickel transport system permease protein
MGRADRPRRREEIRGMLRGYVQRRLVTTVPVMLLVSLFAFLLMQIVPGDPAIAIAGGEASAAQVEAIRQTLGLDRPWYMTLAAWYGNLLRGNLGYSYVLNMPVIDAIAERLPVTLSLAFLSLALTVPVSVAAGVAAACRRGGLTDLGLMTGALLGVSLPNFWIGIMAILLFSVHLGWFPSGGYVPFGADPLGYLHALFLPACVLGLFQIGLLARITRSAMLDTLSQDYVRTARAKGAPEWRTIVDHALRNAAVPIATVIGLIFSLLVTGAVVTEQVFALPGLGRLIVQAILNRDYPLIQGSLLVIAASFVLINLAVDLLYAWLDPRIRYA